MEKDNLAKIELEEKIVNLKAKMIQIGILKGLTHPETVNCSQELDQLLNNYFIYNRSISEEFCVM